MNILLGVTGGIAVYKACEVVRRLREREHEVTVVMTQAATTFVTPMTFGVLSGRKVATRLFGEDDPEIDHIRLARWPDVIRPKSMTHQVGHVVDFMPTLLEIAGGSYPAKRQGKPIPKAEGESLLPIFRGKTRQGHDSLCWYLYGNRAVRQGKWKLVWGVTGKKWELYDMQADRTETADLAENTLNALPG